MKVDSLSRPVVEVRSVSHTYQQGGTQALKDISISIDPGEYVSILGKSGCGKTTLLNLIGGLDFPSSGTILFEGRPLQAMSDLDNHRANHVGFIFQNHGLLPALTTLENVQIPMFTMSLSPSERQSRAEDLLSRVGLEHRLRHRPTQLSGGESQRVAIARAMANQPKILLADEPTGALDEETERSVLDLLSHLNQESGVTLLVVTHDEANARRADRVIRIQDGCVAE